MELELIQRATDSGDTQVIERADGTKHFSGYAALWYDGTPQTEFHLGGNRYERISKGAFDKCIAERQNAQLNYNHSPARALGDVETGLILRSDDKGFSYNLPYDNADPDHASVAAKINKKLIRGSSFRAYIEKVKWSQEGSKHIANITEFAVLEDVSCVNSPAYKGTVASISRSEESSYQEWIKAKAETEKRIAKCK